MDHSRPGVTSSDRPVSDRPAEGGAEDAARAAGGDRAAFERLYRANVARIHSLARRMIGPEVAEEATQDVFVRAWEKLGSFRGEAQFGTWLYRLAINHLLSRRAQLAIRRSRETAGDDVLELIPARPTGQDLSLDFETAIERLPEGARQVFVLHDIEGYKHEEIARMLGVTSGTSKAQLHRARMLMRRVLTRH
jgi:RNA polymerase sigma-70 factor (ECF subfamily)